RPVGDPGRPRTGPARRGDDVGADGRRRAGGPAPVAGRAGRSPRGRGRGAGRGRDHGPGPAAVGRLAVHRCAARGRGGRGPAAGSAPRSGPFPACGADHRDRGGLGAGARCRRAASGVVGCGHRHRRPHARAGLVVTAGQAIDLHAHTLRSDGTDTPAALVARAGEAGLTVLALTDHDTTAGWSEAVAATGASATAPTLVPGIELSCRGRAADGGGVGVHLLGYLFDRDHAEFADERARLRRERVTRLRTMAESMAADGLPIDPDRVCAEAGPAGGRPHLARALVEAGVVPTISDAFTRLLAPGGPYHR